MSKAALNMLARLLGNRERQRGTGVRVLALHPGWIRTDMGGPNAHLSPEEAARDVYDLLEVRSREDGPPFVDRLGEALPW
jgi:NAD(P)-dependent dehydrogenase (short-subunit alcohol dehydrogenase family)